MDYPISRKKFIKNTSLTGIGLSLAPFSILEGKDDRKVRIGFIGVGGRGRSHVAGIVKRSDIEIPALCDISTKDANRVKKIITDAGLEAPKLYTRGETDYKRMLEQVELDAVIISTPWRWHVPMAVSVMKAGAYAGVEVPAAITVNGCWDLVETSEATGMPCMILENVCYKREVMTILNMVRKGLFGEMIHARCGYQHNLMPSNFDENANFGPGTEGFSRWRTEHYKERNGDLYPTHAIGPVAHWLDINRGNRFISIASTATKSRGINNYIEKTGGADHPNADIHFKEGDIVTSTITTSNEESIILTHDTSLPRPYSLGFRCQGTKGIWNIENNSIYLDGISSADEEWESFDPYKQKYDAPLWKENEKKAADAGHGGLDYFVRDAFIQSVKRNVAPPIDVYDAAAWSAISPLSEKSITLGGQPVQFPDFTNGKWVHNERIFGLKKITNKLID